MKNMKFWRQRHQQQKTDPGMVMGIAVGMMLCIFLTVFLMAYFMLRRIQLSATYLEDALACSNLAAAVVNIGEYGFTGDVVLGDEQEVYLLFLNALRVNLNLDENLCSKTDTYICNKVKLEKFEIYNVRGSIIERISILENGVQKTEEFLGQAKAPNGQIVEKTGIYSEISYEIKGYFGESYQARKGKLVDVVSERE